MKDFLKNKIFSMILITQLIIITSQKEEKKINENEINIKKIDEMFKKLVPEAGFPSLVSILVNNTDIIYKGTYGPSSKKDNSDTPYEIGSMSKSFTSLSTMTLVDEGKIQLNETLDKIEGLEEFLDPQYLKRITIRELLDHSSGLDKNADVGKAKIDDNYKGRFRYSNYGYGMLGKIIEKKSGMSYQEYLKKKIFGPLGMKKSASDIDDAKNNGLIYGNRNYFGWYFSSKFIEEEMENKFIIPAGFISTTINDVSKYLQFYLNKDNEHLILKNSSLIDEMWKGSNKVSDIAMYGLGFFSRKENGTFMYYHQGSIGSYFTFMYIIPEKNLAGATFVNAADYICTKPFDIILENPYKIIFYDNYDEIGNDHNIAHRYRNIGYLILGVFDLVLIVKNLFKLFKCHEPRGLRYVVFYIIIYFILPAFCVYYPYYIMKGMIGIPINYVPEYFFAFHVFSLILFVLGIIKIIYYIIYKKNHRKPEVFDDDDDVDRLISLSNSTPRVSS